MKFKRLWSVMLAIVLAASALPLSAAAQQTGERSALDEALNVPGGALVFTADGAYPWVAPEGADYAKSTNEGVPNSSSAVSAVYTAKPGEYLEFDYWCQGEGSYDKFTFKLDGSAHFSYSSAAAWKTYRVRLSGGEHQFEWSFHKDGGTNFGSDCAVISNVRIIPYSPADVGSVLNVPGGSLEFTTGGDCPWLIPVGADYAKSSNEGVGNSNSAVSAVYTARSGEYLEFDYWCQGESGYDKFTFKLDGAALISCSRADAWKTYRVLLRGGEHQFEWSFHKDGGTNVGSDCARLKNVRIRPAGSLDEALNAPGGTLTFLTGEPYCWIVPVGADYAKSTNEGADGTSSTVSTTVTAEPGDRLEFDFQCWGETFDDTLSLNIDGVQIARWGAGHQVWQTYRKLLRGGEHLIEWTFRKTRGANGVGDCALLDNVRVCPSGRPDGLSLDEALNIEGGTLHFESDGDYPWTAREFTSCAKSTNEGASNSKSAVSLTVTAAEGDVLHFDYQYSSESGYDKMIFRIDGVEQTRWSGANGKWESYDAVLSAGEHTLSWSFQKDGSGNGGSDCAMLDNIYLGPVPAKPAGVTVEPIEITGRGLAPAVYRVLPDGALDKKVNFMIKDPQVATVDEFGTVHGVAAGTTELTVTSVADPTVFGTATVTVINDTNFYTVRFLGNGATGGEMAEQTFVYGKAQNLAANAFTRTGYDVFNGWNTAPDGRGTAYADGQSVSSLATKPNGVVTLYAQWTGNPYAVHFDANGGEGAMKNQPFVYGTPQSLSAGAFTRTGLIFAGWNTEADGSGESYADRQKVGELTAVSGGVVNLYAQWCAATCTVRFDGNGGFGAMANQRLGIGTVQHLSPVAFAMSGCHFTGWNTAADGAGTAYADRQKVEALTEQPGGIVTLYAQWEIDAYTVNFDANGGEGAMADQSFIYGSPQSLSANAFTRTGYGFTGWNTEANGTGTAYSDGQEVMNLTAVNGGAVTLYARWRAAACTVRFDGNGGEGAMANQPFVYDSPQRLLANAFTRKGYGFTGWNTAPDGTGEAYADGQKVMNLTAEENGAVTLCAQWRAGAYDVRFDANGGEGAMANQPFVYDSPQSLSANAFTREHHSFTGWNTAPDGTGESYADGQSVQNLTAVNGGAVTLYAQWKIDAYTVNFDANGGEGAPAPQIKTHGEDLTLSAEVPMRENYKFLGWASSPDADCTQYGPGGACTQDGDLTLYAIWYLPGDVNFDGVVDAGDAVLVLRYDAKLIELSEKQLAAGDVNFDGVVDAGDAVLILRYDARLIAGF